MGTELTVDGDTATATAPVDEDGKVEANVNVSSEQATTMVNNATNGTVKVEVEVTDDEADVKEVNVVLSTDLITAVKGASAVTTVEVTTTIATVALPADSLSTTDNILTVKAPATTDSAVLGDVSLTLGNVTEFSTPVTVTVNVNVTTAENPMVAFLKSAGQYIRMRQSKSGDAFTFRTRHFSDFVVVDGALTEADTMEDIGENGYHAYKVEQDETVVAAIQNSDGTLNYLRMGATASKPGDELRTTPEFDFNDDLIFNVVAVIGAANKNA